MTASEFNHTVEINADQLYTFVWKNLGDKNDAAKLVVKTFEELWEQHSQIKKETVKPYLFTLVFHLIRSQKQSRNKLALLQTVDFESEIGKKEKDDINELIERSLPQLPLIQRAVVLLRDYEGYSYAEISEITNISESQVKLHIYNTRKFLKKVISNSFDSQDLPSYFKEKPTKEKKEESSKQISSSIEAVKKNALANENTCIKYLEGDLDNLSRLRFEQDIIQDDKTSFLLSVYEQARFSLPTNEVFPKKEQLLKKGFSLDFRKFLKPIAAFIIIGFVVFFGISQFNKQKVSPNYPAGQDSSAPKEEKPDFMESILVQDTIEIASDSSLKSQNKKTDFSKEKFDSSLVFSSGKVLPKTALHKPDSVRISVDIPNQKASYKEVDSLVPFPSKNIVFIEPENTKEFELKPLPVPTAKQDSIIENKAGKTKRLRRKNKKPKD